MVELTLGIQYHEVSIQLVLWYRNRLEKIIFYSYLTTYTFIATAHGGTTFSFVCWLYNNNMVAGGSRCSAI